MSFRYIPPFLRRDVLGAALKDCTHYAINDSIEFIATFAPWRRQGLYLIRHWQAQTVALRVIRAAVLRICAHSFLGRPSRLFTPITVWVRRFQRFPATPTIGAIRALTCREFYPRHPDWWDDAVVSQSMLVPLAFRSHLSCTIPP
jgi:hypothetical protein